jgi:hypothetical protein
MEIAPELCRRHAAARAERARRAANVIDDLKNWFPTAAYSQIAIR